MLSNKHKDKLIGGLITLLLGTLGYLIKNYFDQTKPATESKTKQEVSNNNKLDSSSQKIENQVSQSNSNNGDVNNTFIKKEIYTSPVLSKQSRPTEEKNIIDNTPKQQEQPAIYQGNISKDQQGGTVIQNYITTEPMPRHLTEEDIKRLMQIPNNFTVNFEYKANDNEALTYINEIYNYLISRNYIKGEISVFHYSPTFKERFLINTDEENKQTTIVVQGLR